MSRDTAGRYFVALLCEVETQPLPVTPRMTGINLGLKAVFIIAEVDFLPTLKSGDSYS